MGLGGSGTLDHFDHLILPGVVWWNGSTPTSWQENLVGQVMSGSLTAASMLKLFEHTHLITLTLERGA